MWKLLYALLLVAGLGSLSGAFAQEWPARPIRIIAPSTPGGAADMFSRLLCDHFSEVFRQSCIVENRAGAGGLIGTAAAAQAAPDGYTLTTSSTAYHVIAPALSSNPGFDPVKDFTHIAYIGGPPNVFVVNPKLAVRSVRELADFARQNPPLDYVSPGLGTLGHLLAERFAQKAGIKLQQVMTKGASQAMLDIIAGNVNVGSMTWTSALGQIRGGKVIPLAVSSSRRLSEFPDLPTLKEEGHEDLTAVSWFALSAPAGLSSAITLRLNQEVAAMLAKPDIRARLERDAVETRVMSPEEFTAFMQDEIRKWVPLVKQLTSAK